MGFLGMERALITGKWDDKAASSQSNILRVTEDVVKGNFRKALSLPNVKDLFATATTGNSTLTDSSFDAWLTFPSTDGKDEDEELLRLSVGVACLHAFIQVNWTGPDLDITSAEVLASDLSEDDLNAKAIAELAYGGEPAYHLAKSATFLRIAQILFALPYHICRSAPWWRLRASRAHQYVLDEPVPLPPSVFSSVEPLFQDFASEGDLAGRLALEQGLLQHHYGNDKAAAELFIRAARHTGLEYELTGALGRRTKFQQTELSQLVLLAESRTRAEVDSEQSTETTRKIDRSDGRLPSQQPTEDQVMPKTLALNDDTLLEQTEFTSSTVGSKGVSRLGHLDPSAQPALHPLDQCILLSLCLNVKNTSPAHGLTSEQMSPYVARVISHPRNWSVHTMALLLRSRLESTRTRTVERSTLQLQALVDQMPTVDSTLSERLLYAHSLPLPSKWELEKELALRFLSLGVVKSAMEIFERLEMWEQVVQCWQSMERPDKGIAIVRDLLGGRKAEADAVISRGKLSTTRRRQALDTAREAKLWCLLGDLEPDNALTHYTRAWEISRGTSGRAARSLGGYHFAHEDYVKAITYLQKAVAINPLLERTWFILGCSCVREERWEEARDAFSRCVSIDDEDGESWNNLASVYLRMGAAGVEVSPSGEATDLGPGRGEGGITTSNAESIPFANKFLAFRALKQGLRFNRENWRMWTNYMVVSMDVGELAEACRAQARIVELRSTKVGEECVDIDVLERLVDAATREPNSTNAAAEDTAQTSNVDGDGSPFAPAARNPNEGPGLVPRVYDLLERTILPRVSSPRIFRAYARLLTSQARWDDAIKAYMDAYRSGPAGTFAKGETETVKWCDAVHDIEEIVDILRNFGPRSEGSRWLQQARSIVRTFVGRSRENFEDDPYWEKLTQLQEELRKEGEGD